MLLDQTIDNWGSIIKQFVKVNIESVKKITSINILVALLILTGIVKVFLN